MKHLKSINEIFGLSTTEKELTQFLKDVEKLKKELSDYNWVRLTQQPGGNSDYKQLIKIRLYQGKNELPYLYKLLPELFEEKNAYDCSCYFTITENNKVNKDSEKYSGILPNKFEFILDHTRVISNNDETRENALRGIMRKINSKYKFKFNLKKDIV
jgi:hypothetical protein